MALTFSAIFGFFSFGVKEYLSRELVMLGICVASERTEDQFPGLE